MKKKLVLIIPIILISTILIILIIGYNRQNKPYKNLETEIINEMKKYYGDVDNLNKIPKNNTSSIITVEELNKYNGDKINMTINNDTCIGYGKIIGQTIAAKYEAYIKCDKYTTNGYEIK